MIEMFNDNERIFALVFLFCLMIHSYYDLINEDSLDIMCQKVTGVNDTTYFKGSGNIIACELKSGEIIEIVSLEEYKNYDGSKLINTISLEEWKKEEKK